MAAGASVKFWDVDLSLGILRKLTQVTPGEILNLLKAQGALLRAQADVLLRRTGTIWQLPVAEDDASLTRVQARQAEALAWAITRASRFGVFRPKCLARSIALDRMLRRAAIPGSRIRIGVRPLPSGITAHAWVTLGGQVLGDDPAFVGRFTEVSDARLAGFA